MKTKILAVAIIVFLSFSGNTQPLVTINNSNFLIHDYVPDTILYGNSGYYNYGDSLSLDINDDAIKDFKFYYVVYPLFYFYTGSLNANCNYFPYSDLDTITLNKPTNAWFGGSDWWNPTDLPDGMFAIRLHLGTNYYYGWIHALASFGDVLDHRAKITIDKYAFCKIPNYPLHLGQEEIVGIEENNLLNTANIFLSNSGNSIIVNADKSIKSVSIFNTSGAIVASLSNIGANSADINIANLAHGSYLVNVLFSDLRSYTRQVVK